MLNAAWPVCWRQDSVPGRLAPDHMGSITQLDWGQLEAIMRVICRHVCPPPTGLWVPGSRDGWLTSARGSLDVEQRGRVRSAWEVAPDPREGVWGPFYNEWECPQCGNKDKSKLSVTRRTCGYLGENFWNTGKTAEIKSRVLHL